MYQVDWHRRFRPYHANHHHLGPERELGVRDDSFIQKFAQSDAHREYMLMLRSEEELVRQQISQYINFLVAADFLMINPDSAGPIADKIHAIGIGPTLSKPPLKPSTIDINDWEFDARPNNPITHSLVPRVLKLRPSHPVHK